MIRLYHIIKKEILEIARQFQFLIMLVVMPVAFILVLSLSMQALFQGHANFTIKMLVADYDSSDESKKFVTILKNIKNLSITEFDNRTASGEVPREVIRGDYKFALVINKNYSIYVKDINSRAEPKPITMLVDPTINNLTQLVVKSQVEIEVVRIKINTFINTNAELLAYAGIKRECHQCD